MRKPTVRGRAEGEALTLNFIKFRRLFLGGAGLMR